MRVPVDWLRANMSLSQRNPPASRSLLLWSKVGLEEEGPGASEVQGPVVVGRVLTREPRAAEEWQDHQLVPRSTSARPMARASPSGSSGAHNFEAGDLVPQ